MPPQITSRPLIFIPFSKRSSPKSLSFDAMVKEYYITVSMYIVHLSTMLLPSVDMKADSGGLTSYSFMILFGTKVVVQG